MTLSACCVSGGPPARLTALLRLLRPAADELVVAVDERVEPTLLGGVAELADTLVRYPFAEPVERPLAWLYSLCTGDWILRVDDDEVPSQALLDALPSVVARTDVTHAFVPRLWLWPAPDKFLDEPPWRPDHQLRVSRNEPGVVRFPGQMHVPIAAEGPAVWLDQPLYHLDLLANDEQARREKIRRYEAIRPGLRVWGRALNEAYYLPESRPDAQTAAVPATDEAAIRSILAAPVPEAANLALRVATREEIDAAWPQRPLPADAYRARIELAPPPLPLAAGEVHLLEAMVENLGTETWRWGAGALPEIRVSYRWDGAAGTELRTPLPHDVVPGGSARVPLSVRAPAVPGRHELVVDLVHEHRRWFGAERALELDVAARRRLVVLAETNADLDGLLADLAERAAELEVVLLARDAARIERLGRPTAPSLDDHLLAGIERGRVGPAALRRLVGRWRRIGGADATVAALRSAEALVVPPAPDPGATFDLLPRAALVRLARRLGVPVLLLEPEPEPPRSLDRLLARTVARAAQEPPPALSFLRARPRSARPPG